MKSFKTILLITISLLMAACSSDDEPQQPTKRTILVYMVASNSLGNGKFDEKDIEEMTQAIQADGLNGCRWLVYHMPFGSSSPELREYTKSGVKTLASYSSSDYAVDPTVMSQVFSDMKRLAPANDYALILWSHSDGWVTPTNSIDNRSFGEDRGYSMSIPDLASAVTGQDFSFIYFDCCYMANVETLYELRNATPLIVASETELPANGMPYDQNLPIFCANNVDLKKACENTFNYYNDNESPKWHSCSISLIDTRHLEQLASISRSIFASGATLSADYIPQQLQPSAPYFLYDFPDYMHSLDATSTFRTDFDAAIADVVVYTRHTERMWPTLSYSWSLDRCNGISSYIVRTADEAEYRGYKTLQWWNDVVSVAFPK